MEVGLKDDSLDDRHHVLRYCSPLHVRNGKIKASAFAFRAVAVIRCFTESAKVLLIITASLSPILSLTLGGVVGFLLCANIGQRLTV